MTDAERAHTLSGATRECPSCHDQEPLKSGIDARPYRPDDGAPLPCPVCQGTGRVFVLGERARKACPGCPDCKLAAWVILEPYAGCHGDGWLSTLLLPDGRWDIGLLIELLEEAGCVKEYQQKTWFVDDVFNLSLEGEASLAVAACKALGVGSEVKG